MQFAQELRDRVRTGEITCSIRIWQRPRVKVGNAYALPPGRIVVDSIMEIALSDVTPELARRSGFKGVVDLLKVAKHGAGERVFYVRFHYVGNLHGPARCRRRFERGLNRTEESGS